MKVVKPNPKKSLLTGQSQNTGNPLNQKNLNSMRNMWPMQSMGKCVQAMIASHDWFCFYFWLDDKVVIEVFQPITLSY